jgi:hypothetical protein
MYFKDFVPQISPPPHVPKAAEYATFEDAVAAADRWIAEHQVRVINIETVVLPNIWSPSEQGTGDAALHTHGDWPVTWYQFVRVWYETKPGGRK